MLLVRIAMPSQDPVLAGKGEGLGSDSEDEGSDAEAARYERRHQPSSWNQDDTVTSCVPPPRAPPLASARVWPPSAAAHRPEAQEVRGWVSACTRAQEDDEPLPTKLPIKKGKRLLTKKLRPEPEPAPEPVAAKLAKAEDAQAMVEDAPAQTPFTLADEEEAAAQPEPEVFTLEVLARAV